MAYIYPPARYFEIAGQRPAKFAKYLPEFGWNAVVITRFWDAASGNQPFKLPPDMPSAANWDPQVAVRSIQTAASGVVYVPFSATPLQRMQLAVSCAANRWSPLVPLRRAISAIQRASGYNFTGTDWLRHGKAAARALCTSRKIDCIVATAPPLDTLSLAAKLSGEFGIPWVADLRDRGSECMADRFFLSQSMRRLRADLRTASAVLVVSEELADSEAYDLSLKQRPFVLPNGFDATEYEGLPAANGATFEICYTGSLYRVRRDPEVFLMGLKRFLDANPNANVAFRYVGTSSRMLNEIAERVGVINAVIDSGHLLREEALRHQANASVLLHLTDCVGAKGIATGKIYEYFAAARPILAVPGDGSTVARLLESTGTGNVARTAEDVAKSLQAFYEEWERTGRVSYSPNETEIAKYSRRDQSKQLAQILGSVSRGRTHVG